MRTGYVKNEKAIIEIAEQLFSDPFTDTDEVRRRYVEASGKSPRTVDRWITRARQRNAKQLKKQEEIKVQAAVETIRKQVKENSLSRERALEILTEVARGKERMIPTEYTKAPDGTMTPSKVEIKYPSFSERINAIERLARLNGWYAPTKTELTGKDEQDLFEGKSIEELQAELVRVVAILTDK
jgi:hypothetical protein